MKIDIPDSILEAGFYDLMIRVWILLFCRASLLVLLVRRLPTRTIQAAINVDEAKCVLELYLPAVQDFFNLLRDSRPTSISFDCVCCTDSVAMSGFLAGEEKATRLKNASMLCALRVH